MKKNRLRSRLKGYYFVLNLHRIMPFRIFGFLAHLGALSAWISKNRNIGYSDFYTGRFDYSRRYVLYTWLIENEELKFHVGNEDVNWAVNDIIRTTNIFKSKSNLEMILPFAVIAIVSIVILMMFIFLFRKLDVMADVANSLQAAAEAMRDAKIGSVVVG